jgi:orotidine-5'-phosphate decarboxylase
MAAVKTPGERLIVALDFPAAEPARELMNALGDAVCFYKIGLELFAAGCGADLVAEIKSGGGKVFADLKLFDVPRTVARAAARLADLGADFITVHGNDAMMREAAHAKGGAKILAVTALTSLDEGDLRDLGFACDVKKLVVSRARRALECGCDGVVASGLELSALRAAVGKKLLAVVPGVRPVANTDDQKRVITPAAAIRAGADYLVVGRPIANAPDPRAAAKKIQSEIAAA